MITSATLSDAAHRAHAAMSVLEQELNQADAILGDGDTGGMLARVIGGLAECDLTSNTDVGASFSILARAALASTGSSLGTLLATALMSFAKASKGKTEVPWSDLSPMLSNACNAMIERGGASLGDKTILDALDYVASALKGISNPELLGSAARTAAAKALSDFRGKPCKIGRARIFAEKSIGIDDPGMLAFAKLTEALTA